jgi:hypothetical protein
MQLGIDNLHVRNWRSNNPPQEHSSSRAPFVTVERVRTSQEVPHSLPEPENADLAPTVIVPLPWARMKAPGRWAHCLLPHFIF